MGRGNLSTKYMFHVHERKFGICCRQSILKKNVFQSRINGGFLHFLYFLNDKGGSHCQDQRILDRWGILFILAV